MYVFLIALAVWVAPAILLGLHLLIAVVSHSRRTEQSALQQPGQQNDSYAPKNAADRDKREIALPLILVETDGGSKLHLTPVA